MTTATNNTSQIKYGGKEGQSESIRDTSKMDRMERFSIATAYHVDSGLLCNYNSDMSI